MSRHYVVISVLHSGCDARLAAGKQGDFAALFGVCGRGRYGLTREEVPLLEYRGWAPALEPAPRGEAFVDVS